jgi:hypothetical protein
MPRGDARRRQLIQGASVKRRPDILCPTAAHADPREGGLVYLWFVYAHLIGLVIFLMAHGASAALTYEMKNLRDPAAVGTYLRLSLTAIRVSDVGLLLLLIGGIGAASVGDMWSKPWIWGSVILLILVIVAMYAVGASYYFRLRDLLAGKDGVPPIEGDALAAYLDTHRPDLLGLIGGVGLLVLVGLMVLKPG